MEPLTALAIVIALAALGELVIEALKPALEPLFKRMNLPEDVNPYLYLALLFGVVLAILFEADLPAAIGLVSPFPGAVWFQEIVTGLLIGRGSNFIHDAISRLTRPEPSISVESTPSEEKGSVTEISVRSEQEA